MEKIFSKTVFPKAPGGDRYEWKDSETIINISQSGLFTIKIDASAKNAKQNSSKDDDDLRVVLDDFDFGKYERHQETISWKGFGTSASWDGASLKGGTKTIYFFVELEKGLHTLQFFADETPTLKSIEIFEIKNNAFELKDLKPPENIKNKYKGIPWLGFIFFGAQTKSLTLIANTKSAKRKNTTDGDNLKIILNGKIQKNPYTSESSRYKNFYFSGNIKEFDVFSISSETFDKSFSFENAVEFWYDEEPEISSLKIEYFNQEEFLEQLKRFVDLKEYILDRVHLAISFFKKGKKLYSAQFLEHALKTNPPSLIFNSPQPLIRKIKADPIYKNILEKLEEKIKNGNLEGEIWPGEIFGEIVFNSHDLDTALHGIRKIEYRAESLSKNKFKIEFTLFDVYDFEKQKVPFIFSNIKAYFKNTAINTFNMGENLDIVNNFEIEINLKETISW